MEILTPLEFALVVLLAGGVLILVVLVLAVWWPAGAVKPMRKILLWAFGLVLAYVFIYTIIGLQVFGR